MELAAQKTLIWATRSSCCKYHRAADSAQPAERQWELTSGNGHSRHVPAPHHSLLMISLEKRENQRFERSVHISKSFANDVFIIELLTMGGLHTRKLTPYFLSRIVPRPKSSPSSSYIARTYLSNITPKMPTKKDDEFTLIVNAFSAKLNLLF